MNKRLLYLACAVTSIVILCSGVLPEAALSAAYGRGALTRSQMRAWYRCEVDGKTREEVVELMGKPHVVRDDGDRVRWLYFGDAFGIVICCLVFDDGGRVVSAWW